MSSAMGSGASDEKSCTDGGTVTPNSRRGKALLDALDGAIEVDARASLVG